MPASYVHQCIAADACLAQGVFPVGVPASAVLAGAEGPDPLFFSLFSAIASPGSRSLPRIARMIHTQRTDEFLLALMDACRGDALLEAYCCGFLSHYAADTVCHPFIYAHALTQDGAYSSTEHCMLEHALETLVYRRRGHSEGLPVQMAGFAALPSPVKDDAAHALACAVRSVFREASPDEGAIRRSFDACVSLSRALRSASGRKYAAAGAFLRPFGLGRALQAHMLQPDPPQGDPANAAHSPWSSIWTPELLRTESFYDLYDAAVARSQALIAGALQYFSASLSYASMRALLGGLSYCSGLPWSGSCPAPKAPGVRPIDRR